MIGIQLPASLGAVSLAGMVTGLTTTTFVPVFNTGLAQSADDLGTPLGVLAETLPQLNTDTWRVFPDGTMETSYRLKANLTWHDGHPLTVEDFVFGQQVLSTREYGVATKLPTSYISGVTAGDNLSVVIKWNHLHADAGQLGTTFPPLPHHLLEERHRESAGLGANAPEFLPNSTFWTSDYVGVGPYKVDAYNAGVSVEASAFDAYALGRPKIDRVSIRGVADSNTALATMLAGEAHVSLQNLRGRTGKILDEEWKRSGGGSVVFAPTQRRILYAQYRLEYADPVEVGNDVRVRRAIVQAIDKQPLFETVTEGVGVLSDTYLSPRDPLYPRLERELPKYLYDPRQAVQLLEEAGFRRGTEGQWTTPRGTPFDLPVYFTSGTAGFETENAIIVDALKRIGINAMSRTFATQLSPMDRALTPGLSSAQQSITSFHTRDIAGPENRWVGNNRSGFSNPEYDRAMDLFTTALDPREIEVRTIEIEKVVRELLPAMMLYIDTAPVAYPAQIRGVREAWTDKAPPELANMHEWYWGS